MLGPLIFLTPNIDFKGRFLCVHMHENEIKRYHFTKLTH